jgi:DNA repair protein RecN (Recombination protein N)
MLVELSITDLALIERATLGFGPGLNVITGETGAGKSLLIDALELLLGQRARAGLVRQGAQSARVEGRFELALEGYGSRVAGWLRKRLPETLEDWEEEGAQGDLELILTRTLTRDGRSRAHVNHRPVTQRVLRELAARLVEIHGQNDHQRLFEPLEQLRLLDTFGALEDTLAGYRERRARWLANAERLERFEAGEADRLQRLDLLRFQARELAEAEPSVEERAELAEERALLRNAGELGGQLGGILMELAEADGAALGAVQQAERVLDAWAERIGALAEPAACIREASAQLDDAVRGLRSFVDGVETNPARLEEVEERLSLLEALERKYRTDTAGLVARRAAIEAEVGQLEDAEQGYDELAAEVARDRGAALQAARRLSRARAKLLERLRVAVERALGELGLARASFAARLVAPADDADDRKRLTPHGAEGVEFQLAANPGEPAQPLRKVASGGEMARIMLALRGALAVRQSTPTLIFDEVDAGVGGRLGPRVGAHLAAVAAHHQVLCVTHLPAIAAAAQRHLRVHKDVAQGRTRTHVVHLAGDARVEEIADMIAGGAAHATARAEAQRLLAEA